MDKKMKAIDYIYYESELRFRKYSHHCISMSEHKPNALAERSRFICLNRSTKSIEFGNIPVTPPEEDIPFILLLNANAGGTPPQLKSQLIPSESSKLRFS